MHNNESIYGLPMTLPLTVWKCDTCGDDVHPKDAIVIWKNVNRRRYDFRIVHQDKGHLRYGCDPGHDNGFRQFDHLSRFLGADGLSYALSLLSPGPVMGGTAVLVDDFNGFVDLVRRTQTPWYEEARLHWQTEQTQDWLDDASESYPYRPDVLKRIAQQELG